MLVGGAVLPQAAIGADGSELQTLPGSTLTALTIDLDHDDANEVLRLVDREAPGFDLEAWDVREGLWSPVASTEVAAHPGPDGSLDPSAEVATLLRWRLDGRDHAVLVTASMLQVPDVPTTVCCIELAEVVLDEGGVTLDPMQTPDIRAELVAAVDMDGDGTDELVTQVTAYHDMNDSGVFRIEVHRWDGREFQRFYSAEREGQGFAVIPGEGDNQSGMELYIAPSPNGSVERLVLVEGVVREEKANIDLSQPFDGWVAGAANGRLLIQHSAGLRLVEWERGRQPTEVGRLTSLSLPKVDLVGSGDDAIFVVYEGFDYLGSNDPRLTVFDTDFNEIASVPISDRIAPVWDAARAISATGYGTGRYLFPWVGPVPDAGPRGAWPYLANGTRIESGGPEGFTTADANPLVGVTPVGRAGPGDDWLALGHSLYGAYGPFGLSDSAVYLFPFGPGPMSDTGVLTLAPADKTLGLNDEPVATIQAEGAVEVAVDGGTRLAAHFEGFRAVIDAPAGTIVTVEDGTLPLEREVGEEPLVIEVVPPRGRGERNTDFTRSFLVMAPDGRAQVVSWEGTFIAEPPEVTAHAETHAFELHSRIYGRASDGVSISVDGNPVRLNESRAFNVEVDAPIWPRDVVVIARDVLGTEVVERLEVVGFLDYRGLPWGLIVSLATVAAGGFLFVRTPRRRRPVAAAWDDAMLEEVDGDAG